jgi:hypothetical protein
MKLTSHNIMHNADRLRSYKVKPIHVISLILLLTLCVIFVKSIVVFASRSSAGEIAHKQTTMQKSRLSDSVSVQAAGRGNPWIKLSDGRDMLTEYSGPEALCQALQHDQVKPLSLCSADYDEDGVPDIISSYAGPSGGIITLLRGNVDSIYPNSAGAKKRRVQGAFTEAPFLSPAYVFNVAEAADFIGSGDFDADGHWDVVAAKRGGDKLYLLKGDGHGGLNGGGYIELQGRVTALITGEINRRDGLDDVIVGIGGADGAKTLVFEGSRGALKEEPEEFVMPAEVASLALGQLDNEYTMDLAVAAGRDLVVIHGRDRRLSLDESTKAKVQRPIVSEFPLSFLPHSIAIGNFTHGCTKGIAMLSDKGKVYLLSEARSEHRRVGKRSTV